MSATLLAASGLRKSFNGRQALADAGLELRAGERGALCGANGAGKTTLLKILAGLLAPDAGEVRVRGDLQAARIRSERGIPGVSLLHQSPFMFAASVRDNVRAACPDSLRTEDALRWAGLSDFAALPARRLSGGMQQRVSLARAHAAAPLVCLMDEPAAHLDDVGERLATDLAASIAARGGAVLIAAPAPPEPAYGPAWTLQDGTLREVKGLS